MFDWLTNLIQTGYDNTFGEMNGKEVLWTIIALLALYQLVMIKWRLIDQNRLNQVPNSFMRDSMQRMRTDIGGSGYGQLTTPPTSVGRVAVSDTVGFTSRETGRHDVETVITGHQASSFQGQRLDRIPPEQLNRPRTHEEE